MAYHGIFKPKNPKKYKGDPTKIVFRSSWERDLCRKFDEHPNILEWSSEEVVIPYFYPADNKYHRYFVDFWVKLIDANGKIQEILYEVKPYKQTLPPKEPKKKTRKYVSECLTYVKNQAKWQAASKYASQRGMTFQILTENEIKPTIMRKK